jgi:tetratricopeptide (TPR) repeat protein
VLLAALLTVAVVILRQQTMRMDWLFFQPSWAGLRGLVRYLAGDYSGAARAYRAHFGGLVARGEGSGDPMLDALLAGDLDEAERAARATLKTYWSASAALTLGEVALERGRPDDAIGAFKTVLDRHPDNVDTLLLSSVAYTRAGDHARAIDALKRALRQGVGSRLTTFLWILETTGDLERQPVDRRPFCLLAHDYRYLRVYDPSNARWSIKRAKQAIARGDRTGDAYLTIGVVSYKQGRPEDALEALAEATRHDPRLAEAHWWAAMISAERGDLASAHRMIRAAFEATPTDPFFLDDVHRILAFRLGDLPANAAVMERALIARPDNLRAHRHLAWTVAVLGDEPRALSHYRRAIELDPKDPTNWEGLGWTLGRLKRDEESIAAYRRAIALAPFRYEPHDGLGQIYERKRRYRDALVEYETALQLGAPTVNTLLWSCVARFNVSEFDRAAVCFRAVLARDPDNAHALRYLLQSEHNARLQRTAR